MCGTSNCWITAPVASSRRAWAWLHGSSAWSVAGLAWSVAGLSGLYLFGRRMGQQCGGGVQRTLSRNLSLLSTGTPSSPQEPLAQAPNNYEAPPVYDPVSLSVSSLGGPIISNEVVVDVSWTGRTVKDVIGGMTNGEYSAGLISLYIGAEDFGDDTILSSIIQGAGPVEVLVLKKNLKVAFKEDCELGGVANFVAATADDRSDWPLLDFEVEVADASIVMRFDGEQFQSRFGTSAVEWINTRECQFRVINDKGEVSTWVIKFLPGRNGFKGTYQSNRKTRTVHGIRLS